MRNGSPFIWRVTQNQLPVKDDDDFWRSASPGSLTSRISHDERFVASGDERTPVDMPNERTRRDPRRERTRKRRVGLAPVGRSDGSVGFDRSLRCDHRPNRPARTNSTATRERTRVVAPSEPCANELDDLPLERTRRLARRERTRISYRTNSPRPLARTNSPRDCPSTVHAVANKPLSLCMSGGSDSSRA